MKWDTMWILDLNLGIDYLCFFLFKNNFDLLFVDNEDTCEQKEASRNSLYSISEDTILFSKKV